MRQALGAPRVAALPRSDYYEDSAPERDIAGRGGLHHGHAKAAAAERA